MSSFKSNENLRMRQIWVEMPMKEICNILYMWLNSFLVKFTVFLLILPRLNQTSMGAGIKSFSSVDWENIDNFSALQ